MYNLLKPIKAGNLELNNRLVMPPMATAKSQSNGKVSDEILNYYKEKSEGGYIGLIIIEHSFIMKQGKASKGQLSIADDDTIEGLRKLANVIQQNGSKAIMQLNHAGSAAEEEVIGSIPVGPSTVVNPRKGEQTPHELTTKEIDDIIKAFSDAARRCKEAGFDGVEIHSAHGYLLNQFFSPLSNKRSDEYGGSVHNRINIHLKIIEAVKNAVGDDFPVLLRLGASDYIDGGITIEDSLVAVKEFEKAGIDMLDISGGFCGYVGTGSNEQGYFSQLTEAIKKVVSIPVILTGGITDAKAAEELLSSNKADLIGVGRTILKDSNWAKNAIESLR